LLAIYEAVKHFKHMLEARHFIIFTDHKPITYAFRQKRDKCSPWQLNHLDFVSQFTTDIRHNSGQEYVVADTLSHVESVTAPPSYNELAASQDSDDELRTLLGSTTALRLQKQLFPGTTVSLYCNTSTGNPRPYIPAPLLPNCSSLSTSCRTPAQKQQWGWSHNVSCGQACGKISEAGHGLARPASALKSPATPLLQWVTSHFW
jgi:hypothetical protein